MGILDDYVNGQILKDAKAMERGETITDPLGRKWKLARPISRLWTITGKMSLVCDATDTDTDATHCRVVWPKDGRK